jgi:hypothetical protein
MAGNVFSHNIVYSDGGINGWDYIDATNGGITTLRDSDNMYYTPTGIYNSPSSAIIDTTPDFANPMFADPASNNYTLQSNSPAAQISFTPIDTSTDGVQ